MERRIREIRVKNSQAKSGHYQRGMTYSFGPDGSWFSLTWNMFNADLHGFAMTARWHMTEESRNHKSPENVAGSKRMSVLSAWPV